MRHGGRFDVDSDEDTDAGSVYDNDMYDGFGADENRYPYNTGDWRQTHDNLIHNIRKAKRAAKSGKRYNSAKSDSFKETKDEGIGMLFATERNG